jgi:YebC/PmpR family DNA-binding regulatory protein
MSGHSKWANIKHQKGAADKRKAKVFSRINKELVVALKTGGTDPNSNSRLRNVLISARVANMPKDIIDRAIKRATGEMDASNYEEIVYEGYGPGGIAILAECLSDNRNRTAGEIRMLFDRGGGNMAGGGSVTWMFHRKSRFAITGEYASEDKLMDIVLDVGAEDIQVSDGTAEIIGAPDAFECISKALEKAGIKTEEAGLVRVPENTVSVTNPDTAAKVIKIIESLEEHDDVQAVYSNVDIPEDVLKKIVES